MYVCLCMCVGVFFCVCAFSCLFECVYVCVCVCVCVCVSLSTFLCFLGLVWVFVRI